MSNNALQNRDCPALMSDGRIATDYRPQCYVHDLINKQNGIKNSHDQRKFLQDNAKKLMNLNLQYFNNKSGCNTCEHFHVDPNGHDRYWKQYKASLEK